MKRFLLTYRYQGWKSEGMLFSDGKVAISEHGAVFDYPSFEDAITHYPASEFDLSWLDEEINWTQAQIDDLVSSWNALMSEYSELKPAIITTVEAMAQLRKLGLVEEERNHCPCSASH